MSEESPAIRDFLARVRVVLVGTLHSGNIGSAARAMKNMGLNRLYLAAPLEFPHREATYRSVQAVDVLENAVVTTTLEEAVADCTLVIGTSARERRIQLPQLGPREMGSACLARHHGEQIALVFGREDSGLNNEELRLCHWHVHVPTSAEYSSLNLAAAVQLLCYELRMAALDALCDGSPPEPQWDEPLATVEGVERFYEHLELTLRDIGFLNPAAPRQLMTRLRRLFNRVRLDQMELNILRGILTEVGKLKASSQRAGEPPNT
jgi:tRNA (cytidine32/uridine32-2'-O)-methyltransferase